MMPSRNPRNLQWKESALNGDGFSDYRFQETQGHVFYSIFGEPLPPWKANPLGDNQNAWTNALEFAIAKTGAKGKASEEAVLETITYYLNRSHGVTRQSKRRFARENAPGGVFSGKRVYLAGSFGSRRASKETRNAVWTGSGGSFQTRKRRGGARGQAFRGSSSPE